MYGTEITIGDANFAVDLYMAAHKYNCLDAITVTRSHMMRKLDVENAILFFEVADFYGEKGLREACIKVGLKE